MLLHKQRVSASAGATLLVGTRARPPMMVVGVSAQGKPNSYSIQLPSWRSDDPKGDLADRGLRAVVGGG